MNGALLVAGTTSDAGKSVIVAGIIRWLAREGVRVAPFNAQNMSINSSLPRIPASVRSAPRLDRIGDLVAEHLDTAALVRLIEGGSPPGLPVVPPAGTHGAG